MARAPKGAFGSREFLVDLGAYVQQVKAEIASASALGAFDRAPQATAARVAQAREDFGFFCRTYFPHHARGEASRFHAWLFAALPAAIAAPEGARLCIAAPRGNAKSTYVSQLFVLWCVITGRKRYPLLLSDALEVAAMLLEGIKAELTDNPRLLHDFPDATGAGPVWQVGTIVTPGGAKVQAGGAGKRIRGARHGAQRPDLVILDDIESDDSVRNPEQRDKREGWVDKAVEPIGPPDGSMDLIYVGTVLHLDSVLARKQRNPLWSSVTFCAVERWPDRMDLWERWEEVLRNDGRAAADAFHAAHQAAMEAGAEVLWPQVQPFRRLMEIRVRIGRAAFGSEYQNAPLNEDDQRFGAITYWVQDCPRWVYFGALDPSLGRQNKARDPSAILVGGLDRETGVLDVVEASIRRRLPTLIIADVIALQRRYRCVSWAVESVQFQEFLRTELMAQAAKAGVALAAVAVTPSADKALRIESLQPPLAAGLIRLHSSQTVLLEQLQAWPQGDHDDGPDCLEMLWRHAVGDGARPAGASVAPARTVYDARPTAGRLAVPAPSAADRPGWLPRILRGRGMESR